MRLIRRVWQYLGILCFWVGWPIIFLYLMRSERTKLLVVADGKILVAKNWLGSGKWNLPGGGIRTGETPDQAVVREVKEELHLTLNAKQIELLTVSSGQFHGMHFTCHYFKANLPWQAPMAAVFPEIFSTAWLDPKTLSAKNAASDVLTALQALQSSNLVQ